MKTQVRIEMTVNIGPLDPGEYAEALKYSLDRGDGHLVVEAWRQDVLGLEGKVFVAGANEDD